MLRNRSGRQKLVEKVPRVWGRDDLWFVLFGGLRWFGSMLLFMLGAIQRIVQYSLIGRVLAPD